LIGGRIEDLVVGGQRGGLLLTVERAFGIVDGGALDGLADVGERQAIGRELRR